MSSSPQRRSLRSAIGLVGVAALVIAFPAAPGQAAPALSAEPVPVGPAAQADVDVPLTVPAGKELDAGRYNVILARPAAVSYDGGRPGLRATRSVSGEFRAESTAVREYSSFLRREQTDLAADAGVPVANIESRYTLASNGFTADLTRDQANDLAADQRVLTLAPDEAVALDTWNTPSFLGLEGPDGVWSQNGGKINAGAGTVVGVLDSGIWPEAGSFRGSPLSTTPRSPFDITMDADGNTRMEKIDGTEFTGVCETGEEFTLAECNTKIVGARAYPEGFLSATAPEDISPDEYISPRDGGGHGSHTASTAIGSPTPNVAVEGREFGTVTGMAPASRLAVYKVCWEDTDPLTGGCYSSATIAALEDAVADNVDAINYSISGSTTTVIDPVELAFEGAAEAGIFIAASAGNSGPTASTVAHNSPWLTTVAASTHANFINTIRLGDGTKIAGASIAGVGVLSKALVTAADSGLEGADPDDLALCGPDTIDPAAVTGKVVVCERGVFDRVSKSNEVERAGGVGMILINTTPSSLDADFHAVPTVHLDVEDGQRVLDYIESSDGPIAAIRLGNRSGQPDPVLPQVAAFSSRGPALANDGDLLKPDVTGPGVSVLAAVAPPTNSGRDYDLYSGTSMSSPHIAGLAAFVAGVHPEWTPMQIKSALMTTASPILNANVFAAGAGQVAPTRMLDPGLFVTSTARDWRGFIAGQGLETDVPAIDATELNGPSFANSSVVGETTFTRTFRATRAGSWDMRVFLPGFEVTASEPRIVSNRANDLIRVTFTVTRTTAPLGEYATGAIKYVGPTRVRMPIAVRPVAAEVAPLLEGTGIAGSVEGTIRSGLTGAVDVTPEGLTAAVTTPGEVPEGDADQVEITVEEGTETALVELDSDDDTADLDLYLFRIVGGSAQLVGQSASGDADEAVSLENPVPGTYVALVDGFSAGDQGSPTGYDLDYYALGLGEPQGDLTITPDPVPVTAGEESTFEVSWSGLAPGTTYLGGLSYDVTDDTTVVRVETTPVP